MSKALLRTVPGPAIHLTASWIALPGTIFVVGRCPGPMPKAGPARLASSTGGAGLFKATFWQIDNDTYGLLAVVRLSGQPDPKSDLHVVLRGSRGNDRDFSMFIPAPGDVTGFAQQLAATAGRTPAIAARFLLELLLPEHDAGAHPSVLLHQFLSNAAQPDGCVELVLQLPERGLLLQGWGRFAPELADLVLWSETPVRYTAQASRFSRDDLQSSATGHLIEVPLRERCVLASAAELYILSEHEIFYRPFISRTALSIDDSIGQMRHLLPRLQPDAALKPLLHASVLLRFQGHDTLNGGSHPVRAALDIAVSDPAGGAYLSGWLYDPANHVAKIEICQGESAEQIDQTKISIPRSDVVSAFAESPEFPPHSAVEVGFAASTSLTSVDGPSAIRVTFNDGDVAFLPVKATPLSAVGCRERLLSSVDMHKPSAPHVITAHLAPFLARSALPPSPETILRQKARRAASDVIVVPLSNVALPRAFLAGFLTDPMSDEEELVFVCGPNWTERDVASLSATLRLYRLNASIVQSTSVISPASALTVALCRMPEAGSFLLVASDLTGRTPGWRNLLRAPRGSIVCPTVLYEDGSVRFAGEGELIFDEQPPFARQFRANSGLKLSITSTTPVVVGTGTIDCCRLNRAAAMSVADVRRFSTREAQEAALFAILRSGAIDVVWQPSVTVIAADMPSLEASPSAASLVDGWMLCHFWSRVPCEF